MIDVTFEPRQGWNAPVINDDGVVWSLDDAAHLMRNGETVEGDEWTYGLVATRMHNLLTDIANVTRSDEHDVIVMTKREREILWDAVMGTKVHLTGGPTAMELRAVYTRLAEQLGRGL